jgi:DNA repair protein RAD50
MSSITSLSIRGNRAFGPEEAATIVVAKPLTVIVGANGCGKTTIIECLKFATTGALPPGAAAGQSFVHDPKMSHASEVKGQIKLKFKNKINQTMVCQRDLQVSAARAKYTYKALDATLMMMHKPADGGGGKSEVVSMSKTTTAMDGLMHELLGVPKAVLEHVVFCAWEGRQGVRARGAPLNCRPAQRLSRPHAPSPLTHALPRPAAAARRPPGGVQLAAHGGRQAQGAL